MSQADSGAPRSGALQREALLWLVPALIYLPVMFLPWGVNTSIYAYIGEVIREGGLPYRDAFEHKGPATYYFYALASSLLGGWLRGPHLAFLLCNLVGARLAGGWAGRLSSERAQLPGAVLYMGVALSLNATKPFSVVHAYICEPELLMTAATLGAILLLDREGSARVGLRALGAGVLLSLACLLKPTHAVVCIFLFSGLLFFAWKWQREEVGVLLRVTVPALIAGVALPAILMALYFWRAGNLTDFLEQVVGFNLGAYSDLGRRSLGGAFTKPFRREYLALTVLAVLGAWRLRSRRDLGAVLLAASWLGTWAATAWQGKYATHQWAPTALMASIPASVMIVEGVERLVARKKRVVVVALAAALAAVMGIGSLPHYARMWRGVVSVISGARTLEEFQAPFANGALSVGELREAGRATARMSKPGQVVPIWGYIALASLEAGRQTGTGHILVGPLVMESPWREKWQRRFLEAFEPELPPVVLVSGPAEEMLRGPKGRPDNVMARTFADAESLIARFPEFERILRKNYVLDSQFGILRLYRPRAGQGRDDPL